MKNLFQSPIIIILTLTLYSCAPLLDENTEVSNSPPDSKHKTKLSPTRFNQIKFVKDSNLNLLSEVTVKFSNDFSYPLYSRLLIFNKDSNEVLLYSSIESRNDNYNISVPFNLEELKVKIISEEKKTILIEKVVKIKQGTLTI